MNKKKKDAIIIILICNAILISLLELIIPIPVPIPGVKLGLANIITIIAIAFLDFKDVLLIVFLRCVVVAVLSKGITVLPFSLTGGLLSAIAMWLLYKKAWRLFSIKGISVVGAIVHNTAQLLVASVILGETVVFYYIPVLLISAVVTGLITGSISELTVGEIEKKGIFKDILQ
ncbi:Gx transporter family protein [Syntrophomonas palmitatica]|uniref:Gx transporter family protein n=1 Tax=Syntrophomonas palmitatica TaxID=402877 RepID=UPI0006D2774F|nr:Gx transporter family protein [Syntrophomonas palmitatica]